MAGLRTSRWFSALAVLASLASACGEPTAGRPPDVLLVSVDTLRADHLGVYGYGRETSPTIDGLAAQGVLFEEALAPTPWTLPSHAAMLTGRHPWELGFVNHWRRLPGEIPLVAESLQAAGYQTAAFVDSGPRGYVGARRGFHRGFDHFRHAPHLEGAAHRYDMAATVDAVLEWLENRDPARPVFLFIHTKSVHAVPGDEACDDRRCFPYDKPEPYRSLFFDPAAATEEWRSKAAAGQDYLWQLNRRINAGALDPAEFPRDRLEVLRALYDAGIAYTDEHLERLLEGVGALADPEGWAVILTSDHGEAFLEHRLFMHQEVYDQLLRVPLIVRAPGLAAGTVRPGRVRLAQVASTVRSLAGAELPEGTAAPLPLAAGGETGIREEDLFAYYQFPSKFRFRAYSLRRGPWKLVRHNSGHPAELASELYHLERDPGERHPVADRPDLLAELQAALDTRLQEDPVAVGGEISRRPAPNDHVRALGYID